MSEIDEVVIIQNTFASRGWFDAGKYDLVVTKGKLLLAKVPSHRYANRLERGVIRRGARWEDFRSLESHGDSIVLPYEMVQSIRLSCPPVQPNMTCYKVGIIVAYKSPRGRMAKVWITVGGLRYQLERAASEKMLRTRSESILRKNQFLAEYAIILKRILVGMLPAEVLKKSQWDIPELAYEIPTSDLKAGL